MTDIERKLRELGERSRAQLGDASVLKPGTRRRIRTRRVVLSGVSVLTLVTLIAGATYAGGVFLTRDEYIGPAQSEEASFGRFFPRFESDRATIVELDATEGTACYSLDSLPHASSIERIEIILAGAGDQADADPVLALKPNERHFSPRGGGNCVGGLDRSTLGEVIRDPASYWLLVVGPTGLPLMAPLSGRSQKERFACGPPVDFAPTYVPDGWIEELQAGSGGGAAWTTVGHYGNDAPAGTAEKARAGFADLVAGEGPYPLNGSGQEVRVLDERALLGEIHEGFSVEFTQHGCDYSLIAFGISRDELRRFAEGLRLPGEFVPAEPAEPAEESFGAIWPEDTAQEASDACNEAQANESWRTNAVRTAQEFGRQMLGWEPAAVVRHDEGRRADVELRRSSKDEGAGAASPGVIVYMTEVFQNCWSVGSVSRLPDRQPTGVNISIRGRDVEIGFNALGADTIYFEMGHGSYMISHDSEPADGRITALLTYKPDQTGHFLLLFKDENGEVFSATGGPLPAGDFAAG